MAKCEASIRLVAAVELFDGRHAVMAGNGKPIMSRGCSGSAYFDVCCFGAYRRRPASRRRGPRCRSAAWCVGYCAEILGWAMGGPGAGAEVSRRVCRSTSGSGKPIPR